MTIMLRSPADLVAGTPYLLGFHPTDSMVLLAFQERKFLFAARRDLPEPAEMPSDEIGDTLVDLFTRHPATKVAFLGYGTAALVDPVVPVVRIAAQRHGLHIEDMLRVDDGRWWSYTCHDPGCCPPEGTLFDSGTREVAASCAASGLVAWPSRAELEQQVAPVGRLARTSMTQATGRARRRFAELANGAGLSERERRRRVRTEATAAVEAALSRYDDDGRLDDDEMAWLSMVLTSTAVRNAAARAITSEQPHLSLWTDATRRVDPSLVAAPASLLAFADWRFGHGVVAQAALERALRLRPSDPMANLLWQGMQQGGPAPATFDQLLRRAEAFRCGGFGGPPQVDGAHSPDAGWTNTGGREVTR